MQKCFWRRSNELYRKSQKAKWGETGRRKEDRVRECGWVVEEAAVYGQVASLISGLNQQPPQLFPQLPPNDEHWPLSAATPQRENWSRHRSAKHTQIEEFKKTSLNIQTQKNTAQGTHLWAALHAHTQSSRKPPCWLRTPVANLMESICRGYEWGWNTKVPVKGAVHPKNIQSSYQSLSYALSDMLDEGWLASGKDVISLLKILR